MAGIGTLESDGDARFKFVQGANGLALHAIHYPAGNGRASSLCMPTWQASRQSGEDLRCP